MKCIKLVCSLFMVAALTVVNGAQSYELSQFKGDVEMPADGVIIVKTGDKGGVSQRDIDNLRASIESASTPVTLTLVGNCELPNGAFSKATNLKSIDVSTYSKIPDNFAPYSSIERVVLSHNVEMIGSNAFMNCENLSSVEYAGAPRTAKSLDIRGSAFANNPSLIDINLSYATSLHGNTVSLCPNLKSVDLSSAVEFGPQIIGSCNKLERVDISAPGAFRFLCEEHLVMQGIYMRAERGCTLILNADKFKGKGRPKTKDGEWLTRDASGTPLTWCAIEEKK